jgi:hypothetical protein
LIERRSAAGRGTGRFYERLAATPAIDLDGECAEAGDRILEPGGAEAAGFDPEDRTMVVVVKPLNGSDV